MRQYHVFCRKPSATKWHYSGTFSTGREAWNAMLHIRSSKSKLIAKVSPNNPVQLPVDVFGVDTANA